jgi:sugar O-acyltransferase (sialic acid O-acetyltransferase NeuD family)
MTSMTKKICIIGTGGFGREVLCCIIDSVKSTETNISELVCFMVDDKFYSEPEIMGIKVIPKSTFDTDLYKVVVAVGDPLARKKIVEDLPPHTEFTTIIHPSAVISKWVEIGDGSIVTAGTVITCNVRIGRHAHLNLNTTIGHDCIIGNFFTTAPAVNISGNCTFGSCVYFGTNAAVRQGITICDNVVVGMGGVVVKNISQEGVYIGSPAKIMEK